MYKLLYLGFAFPPGMASSFPGVNPAGHRFETDMVRSLQQFFEIGSVTLIPREAAKMPRVETGSAGVEPALILSHYKPEISARRGAVKELQDWFTRTTASGWVPDAVLVYNLSPVYNRFVRSLQNSNHQIKRVLLLADSSSLGTAISPWKRLRKSFKPLYVPDSTAITWFDACIGLSPETRRFFEPRDVPWTWMPGGVSGEPIDSDRPREGPISFGYFGALAAHSGILPFVECYLNSNLPGPLRICGYGKLEMEIRTFTDPRLEFAGQLPSADECLRFAATCDVLVNPRPLSHGNDNNFPSKLFQYALTGRSILTSRLSGTEEVLGPAGFFFDPVDFKRELFEKLSAIAATPRKALDQSGKAIRDRVLREYGWSRQGQRIAEFISSLIAPHSAVPAL